VRAEGKKTSQGMPSAVCYPQALYMEPIKVLKINSFSSRHQRPGEKCGLGPIRSWITQDENSLKMLILEKSAVSNASLVLSLLYFDSKVVCRNPDHFAHLVEAGTQAFTDAFCERFLAGDYTPVMELPNVGFSVLEIRRDESGASGCSGG